MAKRCNLGSDAAEASIVLERIQDRLPQWAAVSQSKEASGEYKVNLAREIRPRRVERTVEVMPQYLLTFNWSDSGPGFSWPVAYHLTQVPIYEVQIVTQSADSPDAFGYCDFAIGSFKKSKNPVNAASRKIIKNWRWQRDMFCQSPWAYLFGTGAIDEDQVDKMRPKVWPDGWDF